MLLPIAIQTGIWAARITAGLMVSSAIVCKINNNGTFLNPLEKSYWLGQTDRELAVKKEKKLNSMSLEGLKKAAVRADEKAKAAAKEASAKVTMAEAASKEASKAVDRLSKQMEVKMNSMSLETLYKEVDRADRNANAAAEEAFAKVEAAKVAAETASKLAARAASKAAAEKAADDAAKELLIQKVRSRVQYNSKVGYKAKAA